MPRHGCRPAPSSSRASQPHWDIQTLSQRLKEPVNDVGAVAQVILGIIKELALERVQELMSQPESERVAALSPYVAASLQSAGWLVAALQCGALPKPNFWLPFSRSLGFGTFVLDVLPPLGPDLLRELLQPSAGSHAPGGYSVGVVGTVVECLQSGAICNCGKYTALLKGKAVYGRHSWQRS
jgi:hypothetical protein